MNVKCIVCGRPAEIEDDEPRVCDGCFKCPKCGATPEPRNDFIIDDGQALCVVCERGWSVKAYEKAMMKKHNLKPCPHCKGRGAVSA
jgi:hypothetical protein